MAAADLLVLVLCALCTYQGVVGQDCSALASSGNCSFYPDCVEVQRLACGPTGFSLAYGETYCNRFETFRSNFNSAGEQWVTAVQQCLSSGIFSSSWYASPTDCVELADLGLGLTTDCYVESGLCQDILTDCTNLEALWSILDFSDFTVKLARQLVFEAAGRCTDRNTIATTLRGLQCSNGDSNFDEFIETILSYLECGSELVLDVIYVMDASGSVGATNFDTMRNFVADLTQNLNVGPAGTHVGVIRYSSDATELTALGAILDPVALDTFIRNIAFTGGGTDTAEAIELARVGFQISRQSEGIPGLMIVLTDGVSSSDPGPAAAAARAEGIQILSFGIGSGVDTNQLNDIASGPEFVFLIDSFDQQAFDDVLQVLQLAVCFTPAVIMVGSTICSTIQEGQNRFFQFDFPIDGLTLDVSVLQGSLSVFGSFSIQNPTPISACEIQIIDLPAGSNATSSACSELFRTSVLAPESGGPSNRLLFVGLTGEENDTSFCLGTSEGATNITIGFTQEEYTVTENEGSVRVFVQRDAVMLDRDVSFTISTTMGSGEAIAGEDYVALALTELTFDMSMGSDSVIGVDITIIDDSALENRECFYIMLSFSESCFVDPLIARVCIEDDDDSLDDDRMPVVDVGDDPHFSIALPSGKLLCFTVQGEHGFTFNLISNKRLTMNAMFVPDSHREEVTWLGSMGIIIHSSSYKRSNGTALRFKAKVNTIHIGDDIILKGRNIEKLTFKDGKLTISEAPPVEDFKYPAVYVDLQDVGLSFTIKFMNEHLDLFWHSTGQVIEDSHGIIGQFFRKGVEIDEVRKILIMPNKEPVPVMRRPVWHFMERKVADDQLCWTAMNPGYQGEKLIDGKYFDYLVNDVLTPDFKFKKQQ